MPKSFKIVLVLAYIVNILVLILSVVNSDYTSMTLSVLGIIMAIIATF